MEKTYEILNLDCAHCGGKIEEAVKKIDGVEDANLNFPMRKIKISGDISDGLLKRINEIAGKIEAGVIIAEPSEHHHEHHHEHEHHHHHDGECCCGHELHHEHEHEHHHEHGDSGKKEIIMLAVGVAVFITALILHHMTHSPAAIVLFVIAYLVLGCNVIIATAKNIRVGNFFDENFLMTVATIGAFVLGEYSEAVGVVLFFKIGELFEDYAVTRSRKAITDVSKLKVDKAEVLRNGEFVRIDADEVEIGDILRIKAGERIAVDGVVESGESRIDTSAINGEPVPVAVRAGNNVMSGCINLSETFNIKATAVADDSMIAKIARAVENASAEKPEIDRFITRFSKVYTPVVIVIAVLTAVIGSVVTHDIRKWIYSALTFLVISCPCALVLSVPLAYFSGIGASSKLGILFKGGNSIEALAKVKAVIFDKTGTLTNGSFNVTDVRTCGGFSEDKLMQICGSCEQISSHPVAESISLYCKSKGLKFTEPDKYCYACYARAVSGKYRICCGERRNKGQSYCFRHGEEIVIECSCGT